MTEGEQGPALLRCGMIVDFDTDAFGEPENEQLCEKPARRRLGTSSDEGCCDDCFADMLLSGDFTREELERDYPVVQ